MSNQIKPAQYFAATCKDDGKWWVWMDDGEYQSPIQKCRSEETCRNAVMRWQLRENAAVARENKRLTKHEKVG